MSVSAVPVEKRKFEVFIPSGTEVKEVAGRSKALREAKEWSRDITYPVQVQRIDGRVKLLYQDGQLVRYKRVV